MLPDPGLGGPGGSHRAVPSAARSCHPPPPQTTPPKPTHLADLPGRAPTMGPGADPAPDKAVAAH